MTKQEVVLVDPSLILGLGIEQTTISRIQSCEQRGFELVLPQEIRTRDVAVVAGSKPMRVRISGLAGEIEGKVVVCRNTNNNLDLEVGVEASRLLQSAVDRGVFYLGSGGINVSGDREFNALKSLDDAEALPEMMRVIPRKDPDETMIDGKTYRQTGTIHIEGENLFILI